MNSQRYSQLYQITTHELCSTHIFMEQRIIICIRFVDFGFPFDFQYFQILVGLYICRLIECFLNKFIRINLVNGICCWFLIQKIQIRGECYSWGRWCSHCTNLFNIRRWWFVFVQFAGWWWTWWASTSARWIRCRAWAGSSVPSSVIRWWTGIMSSVSFAFLLWWWWLVSAWWRVWWVVRTTIFRRFSFNRTMTISFRMFRSWTRRWSTTRWLFPRWWSWWSGFSHFCFCFQRNFCLLCRLDQCLSVFIVWRFDEKKKNGLSNNCVEFVQKFTSPVFVIWIFETSFKWLYIEVAFGLWIVNCTRKWKLAPSFVLNNE